MTMTVKKARAKNFFFTSVVTHAERNLREYLRSRLAPLTALVTPLAWLIFFGFVLTARYDGNYLDYIIPSILVMIMLTTSLADGAILVYEKILGHLNKFLALPAPRESILYGKILFVSLKITFQATVLIIVAVLLGVDIFGPASLIYTYLMILTLGVLFASLGTTIGLMLDEVHAYYVVDSIITMPLFFASSALMPYDSMPGWLRFFASVNPLSFALDNLRSAYAGVYDLQGFAVLALFTFAFLLVCTFVFRKVTI